VYEMGDAPSQENAGDGTAKACELPHYLDLPLYSDLALNLQTIKAQFKGCSDMVYRELVLYEGSPAAIVMIGGADSRPLDVDVLPPLTELPAKPILEPLSIKVILAKLVHVTSVARVPTLKKVIDEVLSFRAVLLVHGDREGLSIGTLQYPQRAIEEPATEAVIRGPHEGFNESVDTSIIMIRRKIRSANLKTETFFKGSFTKSKIVLCYVDGIVDAKLVSEFRRRIERIEIDGILESGYIEELIEDSPFSPLPQLQNTERPDVVCSLLLEGRCAILIDGTPFALCAPINLWGALTSPEDYYERYFISNLLRFVRFNFTWVALLLPSLYIAITTFHQEALPSNLLISIAAARENIPYPAVVEAFIMEFAFEALREAGVRLPKQVGQAVSIVGALVIGQAAVEAGLVSAPMVIVVSITGVASFSIPRYNFAISIRLLRFPMMLLAGVLGFYGILIGCFAILIHLTNLRSLGVPYLQPVAPLSWSGLKDTIVRVPWWAMRTRPVQTTKGNVQRQTLSAQPRNRLKSGGKR